MGEEERSRGFTWQSVVTPPLHVQRAQIQSHMLHKLEQPLPQSIHQHVVLCVQFSRTPNQTTQQRVNSTWGEQKVPIVVPQSVTQVLPRLSLLHSPSKTTLQGVKKALYRETLGN